MIKKARKNALIFILSLCILFLFSFTALAVDIRVLLGNYTESAELVVSKGSYVIMDDTLDVSIGVIGAGEGVACAVEGNMMKLTVNGADINNRAISYSLVPQDTDCIISFNSQKYRDGFRFAFYEDSRVNVLNVVEMEHYLYGVVGREIGYSAPMEALKAQAVVSRTYAYANINPSNRYDVVATVNSQVYGGYAEEFKTNAALIKQSVDETAGVIMLYNGKAFPAYFSANAGGHTENIENVWGGSSAVPFVGVESPYDNNGTSSYSWAVSYSKHELESRADAFGGKDIGEIRDIVVVRENDKGVMTVSGRVYKLEIIGTLGKVTAYRDNIRSLLGLKSTMFDLFFSASLSTVHLKSLGFAEKTEQLEGYYVLGASGETIPLASNKVSVIGAEGTRTLGQAAVNDVVIEGNGYGHGVGMSQTGAIGMANAGHLYEDILMYYYFNDSNFSFSSYVSGSEE